MRLRLLEDRRRAELDLQQVEEGFASAELEERFVEVAHAYALDKGISYQTWRQAGVPASVLKRAGIARTRS